MLRPRSSHTTSLAKAQCTDLKHAHKHWKCTNNVAECRIARRDPKPKFFYSPTLVSKKSLLRSEGSSSIYYQRGRWENAPDQIHRVQGYLSEHWNGVASREAHTLYLTLRSKSMSIRLPLESWLRQSMFHLLGPVSVDSSNVSNVWLPCVITHSNRLRL